MTTWNPGQLEAISTLDENLCVIAAAGSGKTSVLIERIARILETENAPLEEIVAITFTDAAAAEMRERLRAKCREKESHEDAQVMERWRGIARCIESARISTIHSFCASILRENALAIGVDPDFALLSEAESFLLLDEVVAETVHELLANDDKAALRAATELRTNALIGETTKWVRKAAMLEAAASGLPLDNANALRAVWRERAEALRMEDMEAFRKDAEVEDITGRLAAIEGYCNKGGDGREVLRKIMLGGLRQFAEKPELEAFDALLEQLAQKVPGRSLRANWESALVYDDAKDLQERLREIAKSYQLTSISDELEFEAAQLTCDLHHVFRCVLAAYEEAKSARTVLDYNDLIRHAVVVLRDNEGVRNRLARGISHLLMDEFQDTDPDQYEIARLLQKARPELRVFIVGDAKQSIYRFRGAEVEVFHDVQEHGGGRAIHLDCNYRTVAPLIHFINDFFKRTGLLAAVEEPYHPMAPSREAPEACRVEFIIPQLMQKEGVSANLDEYRAAEAGLLARRIAAMCGGSEPVMVGAKDGGMRAADYGDVAMLFRAFSDVPVYERALREQGVPYQVVAGVGYYARQEVMDIVNLLHVLVNPMDEMILAAFLRGPIAGLSDNALVELASSGSLVSAFQQGPPEGFSEADALAAARTLIAALRTETDLPLPALIRRIIERTQYEALALSQHMGVQRALNVRKLIDLALAFTQTGRASLPAFVRYLEEIGASEVREGEAAYDADSRAVTLMTIHKAKGLEFPIVCVPDLARAGQRGAGARLAVERRAGLCTSIQDESGESAKPALLQLIARQESRKEKAEAARLLYVAMTRVRDWLILSGAPERQANTLMESFEQVYHVVGSEEERRIRGEGWEALVRRQIPESAGATAESAPAEHPPFEVLRQRIAPIHLAAAPCTRIPVNVLAKAMARDDAPMDAPLPHSGPAWRIGHRPCLTGNGAPHGVSGVGFCIQRRTSGPAGAAPLVPRLGHAAGIGALFAGSGGTIPRDAPWASAWWRSRMPCASSRSRFGWIWR